MTADAPARSAPMRADTAAWLAQPELRRLWVLVARRLETNGVSATGTVRLVEVTPDERQAIAALLGEPTPVRDGVLRVRLERLDARLRSTAAGRGLAEVLPAIGHQVVDRAGRRRADRDAWSDVWTSSGATLADHGLAETAWSADWLTGIRRSGSLARFGPTGAAPLLTQAIETLAALLTAPPPDPSPDSPPDPPVRLVGRGELAERITGTAHGLDDGSVLARLVLRGLALARGDDPLVVMRDAAGRRALWRSAGVIVDEVSSTVLTYGLAPLGDGWREAALRERAEHAQETHLTLREVASIDWRLPSGALVRVCENPRVVEAAVAAAVPVALVCAAGNPSTVVLDLLSRLAAGGARLAYHGDFDWPGIALANRMIARFAAAPWRMSADDYEHAVEIARRRATPALPLAGSPVEAAWDPELTAAMTALDVTVHEESVLETLLTDLTTSPRPDLTRDAPYSS